MGQKFHAVLNPAANNSKNFLRWFLDMVASGFLSSGDVVIMDSAPIHVEANTLAAILEVCDSLQLVVRYQPFYSPEFNAW